eukprot:g3155.t1
MSQSGEQKKILQLKSECERLRDDLSEMNQKLKEQKQLLEDVDAKERLWRKELGSSMTELADLDGKIEDCKRRVENIKQMNASEESRTAMENLDDLLAAANSVNDKRHRDTALTDAQLRIAVAYAAVKRLRKSAGVSAPSKTLERWRDKGSILATKRDDDGEDADRARSICVLYGGRSCVFGIDKTTKFIEVLRQACEYWSLPCTGVLLLDDSQNAYPLNDIIFECPDGVPTEVMLKQGTIRDLPDRSGILSDVVVDDGDESGGATKATDESTADREMRMMRAMMDSARSVESKRLGPKRNPVDLLKYSEMFVYLLSVALYVTSAYLALDTATLSLLHDAAMNNVFETPFVSADSNVDTIFRDITTEGEFWQWVEGPLKVAVGSDGTTTGTLACPTGYAAIDTSVTEGSAYGTVCYPTSTNFNFSLAASVCDPSRNVAFDGNQSCLLVPGPAFANDQASFYDDLTCKVVPTTPGLATVCDTLIGYYTLLRFNHLQGPIAVQQYRVQGRLDANDENVCPEPYVAPDFLNIAPKQCFPPYEYDEATASGSANVTTTFPSLNASGPLGSCAASNCTFLQCVETSSGSWLSETSVFTTLGGPYLPGCTFDAYLSPDATNFQYDVDRIKGSGWLDERTRALRVVANFYNPSVDVVVVVEGLCEFTAGGSVACHPHVEIFPVRPDGSLDIYAQIDIVVLCLLALQMCMGAYRLYQMGCASYFGCDKDNAAIVPLGDDLVPSSSSKKSKDSGPDYAAIRRYDNESGNDNDDETDERGSDDLTRRAKRRRQRSTDEYGSFLNVIDVCSFVLVVAALAMELVFIQQSESYYQNYRGQGSA